MSVCVCVSIVSLPINALSSLENNTVPTLRFHSSTVFVSFLSPQGQRSVTPEGQGPPAVQSREERGGGEVVRRRREEERRGS